MRTKEPIQIVCDGPCGRSGAGFRVCNTVHLAEGPVNLQTIQPPAGWKTALVRPDISLPAGQAVDANMSAPMLARATGGGVEAVICDKCQKRLKLMPVTPEVTDEVSGEQVQEHEAVAALEEQRAAAQKDLQ